MFAFKLDKADHIIRTDDTIVNIELSPFEWSANFALVAYPRHVVIANVGLEEENGRSKVYEVLDRYFVTDRPTALAISQECMLTPVMKVVQVACATTDNTIHLIEDGLENKVKEHTKYTGHTGHINGITFDNVSSADILASVSDDLTCRIWSIKEHKCILLLHLSSPGMAVKLSSNSEVIKLVVGEKKGIINIYNLPEGKLIWCLQTFLAPLMDMDCLSNDPHNVAAICNDYLFMWDLRRKSSIPSYKEPLIYPGTHVRYSNLNDASVAIIAKPFSTLSISKFKFGNAKASVKLP